RGLGAADVKLVAGSGLAGPELELGARPIADSLYHPLAASLLLAEGQHLRARSGDFRKFLVGTLYTRRWLRAAAPHEPVYSARHLDWLEALINWTPVPSDAVTSIE